MSLPEIRPLALWSLVSSSQFKTNSIDFYESLCMLYEPFIQQNRGALFDVEKLRAYSANELMLPLPDDVAQIISGRLETLGWLRAEGSSNDATVYRCHYPTVDKETSSSKIDDNIRVTISTFKRFVKEQSVDFDFQDADIEDHLLRFITKNLNAPTAEGDGVSSSEQIEYWIARFVSWAASHDATVFSILEQLSGTCLLAEAIMEMRSPSPTNGERTDLTVFLDGPLVMELLGLSGSKNKDNIEFVVQKLREQGANIACFRHNCDEIYENLHGVLERSHLERTGPTADALRRGEITDTYVISIKNNVEHFVKTAAIQVIPSTPLQYKSSERYCDQNTAIRLTAQLPGNRDVGRQRDADSVTIVMRRRQGAETHELLKSKFVLLTGNHSLITAANRILREAKALSSSRQVIGPALHHRVLSGYLFANFGLSDKKEVSRRQLLATCSRILLLRPRLIEKMRQQLDLKKRPEDLSILEVMVNQPRATEVLMDMTVGRARTVSPANVDEVLSAVRKTAADEVRAEYEERLASERATVGDQLEEARRRMQDDFDNERQQRLDELESSEQRGSQLQQDIERERADRAKEVSETAERIEALSRQMEELVSKNASEHTRQLKTATSVARQALQDARWMEVAMVVAATLIFGIVMFAPVFYGTSWWAIIPSAIAALLGLQGGIYLFFDLKFTFVADYFEKRAISKVIHALQAHHLGHLEPELSIDVKNRVVRSATD
ncbi:hypothetical protein [Agrobacterium tumefaciens]|uniref:hypothetical protein n=1 Tax=Agrobacterium tumefaciens TaxID=358 RepID=UPI003B9F2AEF